MVSGVSAPLTVLVVRGLRVHQCPKVASNSIAKAVRAERFASPEERGAEERFIPVRHPLDRLISCWAYFCAPGAVHRLHGAMGALGYRQPMPFEGFLEIALARHAENPHTRRQIDFAGPYASGLCPLHRLPEAWKRLRGRFPALGELRFTNASHHGFWPDFYDAGMRRRAEAVYAADVVLYEKSLST